MISNREALDIVLTIPVEGQDHELDFDELVTKLKIDPNDLDTEAAEQPALYVWVGVLAEEAAYEATQAKRALELYRSARLQDVRNDPPKGLDGKRVANAAFEAVVDAEDKAQALAEEYQAALRIANLMAIAKEAARSRAGLIRDLASRQRQDPSQA